MYQRRDGLWVAAVTRGGVRRVAYGRTKEAALAKLRQLQGNPLPGIAGLTVAGYLDTWLEMTRNRVAEGTWVNYRTHVTKHIGPALGALRLADLGTRDVVHLYGRMTEAGVRNNTQRAVGTTFSIALKNAARMQLLPHNPCSLVGKPPKRRYEPVTWSRTSLHQFLTVARSHRLFPLFVLAIDTGCRMSELFALEWDAVDLDAGYLSIRRVVVWVEGRPILKQPKTAASRRRVALSRFTCQTLAGLPRRHGLLFTNGIGTYLHPGNFRTRVWYPLLAKAGVPVIRFHDLRHTCASLCLAADVHPKRVQERLGHAGVQVTMDTYSHILPTDQAAVVAVMDALLSYSQATAET